MSIVVVSTAFSAPTMGRCKDSVRTQTIAVEHLYVDAANQIPPCACAENLYRAVYQCRPDDIVVWLDGDDWLAHNRVVEYVAEMYQDPTIWLTYGSYTHEDGTRGCASAYPTGNYRQDHWRASHLKTFRAGLFQKIKPGDLKTRTKQWLRHVVDQAVMLPMLEMAGPAHVAFCPETLAIYNYAASFEKNASPAELRQELDALRYVRSLPPYARLESL